VCGTRPRGSLSAARPLVAAWPGNLATALFVMLRCS
jgi:hypothetical protein